MKTLLLYFYQADVNRNGTIDYAEFITATMHRHRLDKEENIYKAFQFFDKDGSGFVNAVFYKHLHWKTDSLQNATDTLSLLLNFRFITRDELKQAMSQYDMGDEDTVDEIINDVDIDGVLFFSLILTAEYSHNIFDRLAT